MKREARLCFPASPSSTLFHLSLSLSLSLPHFIPPCHVKTGVISVPVSAARETSNSVPCECVIWTTRGAPGLSRFIPVFDLGIILIYAAVTATRRRTCDGRHLGRARRALTHQCNALLSRSEPAAVLAAELCKFWTWIRGYMDIRTMHRNMWASTSSS